MVGEPPPPAAPVGWEAFAGSHIIAPRAKDSPAIPPSALTLLLLAVGAYLLTAARELLVAFAGRNVASPLGHPIRVEIMRHVQETPGLTRSQLAAKTSVSPLLARHHLRILRRAGLLDVVRSGNADAYMLNHASFRFFLNAKNPPGSAGDAPPPERVFVAGALAVLNHPTRRRLCEVVRRIGPLDYEGLVRAWNDQGEPVVSPTRRDVSYHAALMVQAGLLARRPDGRRVIWALNLDLDEAFRLARRGGELRSPHASAH